MCSSAEMDESLGGLGSYSPEHWMAGTQTAPGIHTGSQALQGMLIRAVHKPPQKQALPGVKSMSWVQGKPVPGCSHPQAVLHLPPQRQAGR